MRVGVVPRISESHGEMVASRKFILNNGVFYFRYCKLAPSIFYIVILNS
jgi:hypothetical protein